MARVGVHDQIKKALQDLIAPELHVIRGEMHEIRGEMHAVRSEMHAIRRDVRVLDQKIDGSTTRSTRSRAMWPVYEAALKASGIQYEMYIYPGTQHGFHNNSTP